MGMDFDKNVILVGIFGKQEYQGQGDGVARKVAREVGGLGSLFNDRWGPMKSSKRN